MQRAGYATIMLSMEPLLEGNEDPEDDLTSAQTPYAAAVSLLTGTAFRLQADDAFS